MPVLTEVSPPEMWQPNLAEYFKQEVMDFVAQNPERVAAILNAKPEASHAILQDWAHWTSWADGRAPPLVAMIRDVTLIILNSMDHRVEVFSPLSHRLMSSETCGSCT